MLLVVRKQLPKALLKTWVWPWIVEVGIEQRYWYNVHSIPVLTTQIDGIVSAVTLIYFCKHTDILGVQVLHTTIHWIPQPSEFPRIEMEITWDSCSSPSASRRKIIRLEPVMQYLWQGQLWNWPKSSFPPQYKWSDCCHVMKKRNCRNWRLRNG